MGDVAMLAARLVGRSGEVVGVDYNARFLVRARERAAAAGLNNVTFIQADANALDITGSFNAVVGRFVLNHNPDPVGMLRSVTRFLIPGGVIAFQEIAVSPALAVAVGVPLWSRVLTAIRDVISRSGMSPDAGLALYRMFQEAGLPMPHMHLEVPFTQDSTIAQLEVDLLRTLRPVAEKHGVSFTDLRDFETLACRIHDEAIAACSPIGFMAVVSAWSRRTN
jgi:SAM-dependent methyltransferase